jgi:transcriptional regulator with XRE-family HTH domain
MRKIESTYKAFGKAVYKYRNQANLSQKALAEIVGLTRSSIANIEAGKQRVLLHDIAWFAYAMQIEPETLVADVWRKAVPPSKAFKQPSIAELESFEPLGGYQGARR